MTGVIDEDLAERKDLELRKALYRVRLRDAKPDVVRYALEILAGANLELAEMALRIADRHHKDAPPVAPSPAPRHAAPGGRAAAAARRRPRLVALGQHRDDGL